MIVTVLVAVIVADAATIICADEVTLLLAAMLAAASATRSPTELTLPAALIALAA